jgi:UDP-glucose 4-epimerase
MRGVDVVFHHAAVVSVPDSIEDPLRTHRINAGGTLSVLIAARDAGARRVIYAASSSAYGPATDRAIKETHQLRPISPYGAAKLAGELYCRSFTAGYGLPTVCLRYFNVFGPRQDAGSGYAAVIPAFAAAMLDGRPPTIFGDGLQSRDFVHVADVAEANVLAASTGSSAIGRVFNIGSGRSRSLLELIETLRAVIGPNAPQPVFAGPRAGDIRDSRADITAARRALGFQPRTGFEDGIREYVRSLDRSAI